LNLSASEREVTDKFDGNGQHQPETPSTRPHLEAEPSRRRRRRGQLNPALDRTTTTADEGLWFQIGSSLGQAGLLRPAITLLEQLRSLARSILGPEHRDTSTTWGNVAYWRGEAGDPIGAATAFEALLTDQIRVLGPDHADTLTRNNLARWRGEAGDPAGAATASQSLLADQSSVR
jgi:hypothetical protein